MEKKINNVKLTDEQKALEEVLSCIIERQNSSPSPKNKETLFNALKSADVYLPAKIILDDEAKAMLAKGVKLDNQALSAHTRCIPELIQNRNTGAKAMCVYSREIEMGDRVDTPDYSFVRLPFVNFLKMADNLPDAFDIILDFKTHPVIFSLDELLYGVLGEGEAPEGYEQETEADD